MEDSEYELGGIAHTPMNHEVEQHGFSVVSRAIEPDERQELLCKLGSVSGAGRRGLLALPAVAELARSRRLLDLVRPYLPSEPFPVRAIYFDKSSDTNWLVSAVCSFKALTTPMPY